MSPHRQPRSIMQEKLIKMHSVSACHADSTHSAPMLRIGNELVATGVGTTSVRFVDPDFQRSASTGEDSPP